MRLRQILTLAVLSLPLVGCRGIQATTFSTDPPGARVFLDGKDSGFSTPCVMAVDGSKRVDFVLPGFATATRSLEDESQRYLLLWREMNVGSHTWKFPLWLSYRDLTVPIQGTKGPLPQHLFVRLRRADGANGG